MENLWQKQRYIEKKTGKEIEERNGIKTEGLQRTERIYELPRKRKNIEKVMQQKGSKKGKKAIVL